MVIYHYTNKTITKYLNKPDTVNYDAGTDLTAAEQVMMSMLEDSMRYSDSCLNLL